MRYVGTNMIVFFDDVALLVLLTVHNKHLQKCSANNRESTCSCNARQYSIYCQLSNRQ